MAVIPSLQQLRYLVAVADKLSFTKAAEACRVSQSTLSAGLKELEKALGVRLVERGGRRVALSPQGQAVLRRARELVAGAEDLATLARTASPLAGSLRLGVIPTIAPFLLPALLRGLRGRFPGLRVGVREDLTLPLLERLRDRRLDLGLIALPHDTRGLLTRPLFEEELYLVGRPGATGGRPLSLASHEAGRLILLERGHCLREHTLRACRRNETANPEGLEPSSLPTLLRMVQEAGALTLLPRMAVEAGLLKGSRLARLPLRPPLPTRGIALVARPATPAAAALEALAGAVASARGLR